MTRLAIAALALLPSTVLAQRPADVITLPLSAYGTQGHRSVAVVAGGDTLFFLFDTGGGVTAITPALAARLGCVARGRSTGFRMTGELLQHETCRGITLEVGHLSVTTDAIVRDLAGLAGGPGQPPLAGMVSLHTLAGQAVTLDLAHDRVAIESERSLAARVRRMTPLRMRIATGPAGGEIVPFVGVATSSADLWLEWDSGHQGGSSFLASHAAAALGVRDTSENRSAETTIRLAPALAIDLPVQVKRVILDGVLGARTLARATWTVDLATQRMWVGAVEPLLAIPAAASTAVPPPARDPVGWYEVRLTVGDHEEPAILHVTRGPNALAGVMRFVGNEGVYVLRDVSFAGDTLTFLLPMRRAYPVRVAFDGPDGRGTWGAPGAGGGAIVGRKVR